MATKRTAAPGPSGGLLGLVRRLPLEAIGSIEDAVGVPFNRWTADAPKAGLYPLVMGALTGAPPERFERMTVGEIFDAIAELEAREDTAGPSEPSGP